MHKSSKALSTAVIIRGLLKKGLHIPKKSCEAVKNCLGLELPGGIKNLAENLENAEYAPVACLLFSPDELFQARLEEKIFGASFSTEEVEMITEILLLDPPETFLTFSKGNMGHITAFPGSLLPSFIEGLNLSAVIPGRLSAHIKTCIPKDKQGIVLAKIRNRRLEFRSNTLSFLEDFLYSNGIRLDLSDLQFILDFMAAHKSCNMKEALINFKKRLGRVYHEAMSWERERTKSNMETLAMTLKKSPHLYMEGLSEEIVRIERILAGLL